MNFDERATAPYAALLLRVTLGVASWPTGCC
jgi:hypothetical protein